MIPGLPLQVPEELELSRRPLQFVTVPTAAHSLVQITHSASKALSLCQPIASQGCVSQPPVKLQELALQGTTCDPLQ